MNFLFENWTQGDYYSSLWNLAGWTMYYFLVIGTLVALTGALLRLLCRGVKPIVRYSISLANLVVLVLIPFAVGPWLVQNSAKEKSILAKSSYQSLLDDRVSQTQDIFQPAEWMEILLRTLFPDAGYPQPEAGAMVGKLIRHGVEWMPWVWIVGAPITFMLLTTGLVGSASLRRNIEPIAISLIADICVRLRDSLRITREVSVAVYDRITQPVLIGIVRPLILLPPTALTGWSPEELEMVLLHELAHVRRWDNLVNLLQRIVESLLFFHPAIWLVSRQVRRDREQCCDAIVVAHTDKRQAYAKLLVNMVAMGSKPASLATASAMADHPLAGRIRRILNLEDEPMLVLRSTFGVLVAAGVGIVLASTSLLLDNSGAQDAVVRSSAENSKTIQVFHDAFDGSYDAAWSVLNHNPAYVSLTKRSGMLTITTERGGIWHGFNNAKNIFLIDNPITGGGDFVMTTHLVGFDPETDYNQAGLICFDDMDNYLLFTLQWDRNQGGRGLCLVREANGKDLDQAYLEVDRKQYVVWLRIIKKGDLYIAAASWDGQHYQIIGAESWGNSSPLKVGLIAKNGGPNSGAPELDASFDYFNIAALDVDQDLAFSPGPPEHNQGSGYTDQTFMVSSFINGY